MKKKNLETMMNFSLDFKDKEVTIEKTIDSCDGCKYSTTKYHLFTQNSYDYCDAACMKLKDYPLIPLDCPLEDYKR